jgi:hypothetical protein
MRLIFEISTDLFYQIVSAVLPCSKEVFIIFTEEDIVIYPSNPQSPILYKIDAKTSIISSTEYEIASENQSIPLVVSAQSLAQALQKESEIKIQFRLSAIKPLNKDEPQLPFLKILHKSFDQVVTVEHNIFVKFFEEKNLPFIDDFGDFNSKASLPPLRSLCLWVKQVFDVSPRMVIGTTDGELFFEISNESINIRTYFKARQIDAESEGFDDGKNQNMNVTIETKLLKKFLKMSVLQNLSGFVKLYENRLVFQLTHKPDGNEVGVDVVYLIQGVYD